jgi:glyoxylase-like metal-dependent hydrolase (beta-lactamase superfamily II)
VEILGFVTTLFGENCYVLKDGGEAIVVDPGEATPEVMEALEGCTVTALVNTHGHIDHVGGNAAIVAKFGCELLCHREAVEMMKHVKLQGQKYGMDVEDSPDPDRFLDEGDTVKVGEMELRVVNCPGHAPGHIALVGDGFVIGGDVLFQGSIGRVDLPGGSMDVLMASIRDKFLTLPDDTVVLCGHGPNTTIGHERITNPFIMQYLQ